MKSISEIISGTLALTAALTMFSATASAASTHHEAQRAVAQHVVHHYYR